MTALREAAKQALEALEHIQRCIGFATATIHQGSATWCQSEDAIASNKAALAQQGGACGTGKIGHERWPCDGSLRGRVVRHEGRCDLQRNSETA